MIIGQPAGSERRRARRARVLYAASIVSRGQVQPVKLHDLSAQGAQVEGAIVSIGEQVELVRAGHSFLACVRWVSGNRAGLEFTDPPGEQQQLRELARPLPQA